MNRVCKIRKSLNSEEIKTTIFEEILSSFLLTEEKIDVRMIHDAQLIEIVDESTIDRRFSFKSLRLSDADA